MSVRGVLLGRNLLEKGYCIYTGTYDFLVLLLIFRIRACARVCLFANPVGSPFDVLLIKKKVFVLSAVASVCRFPGTESCPRGASS